MSPEVFSLWRSSGLKRGQRHHQIGGKGETALKDSWSDFVGLGVGVLQHFVFGVQIVDIMEREGLWGAGERRRTEFMGAVVGCDEV